MYNIDEIVEVSGKVDVLIVGAGLSGLTSAFKISQKEPSLSVRILEASNCVGGQLFDSSLGEIGGKWITEDQYHIYNMLRELKIPLKRRNIIGPELKRCWGIDHGIFARLVRFELRRYTTELDLKSRAFITGTYERIQRVETMEEHIRKKLFFGKSRSFMLNFVQLICGSDPREVSFLEFLSVCHSCGGLNMLMNLYLHTPTSLLEFSSDLLMCCLKNKMKQIEILLQRKVCEITQKKDYVLVRDCEGTYHAASAVIVAIPMGSLTNVFISPQLPPQLKASSQRNRQMLTSFIAQYDNGYWRQHGYSGNFTSEDPPLYGLEYRPTLYSGLTLHQKDMEPQLIQSICLNTLAAHFGQEMLNPSAYLQRSYEQNTLVFMPQTIPWNRLIWSSSASAATCYRGCLSGAVQSGLRAAMHALLITRPQSVTFQDIAEIQRASAVHPKISRLQLLLSSLNLYNCTFYGLLTVSLTAIIKVISNCKK